MPVTEQDVDGLRARMKHFIDERRDPIAHLSVEELSSLQALHNESPQRADQLLRQLRDHAATVGWSVRNIGTISFNVFIQGARALRATLAEANRASNIILMNERRASNAPRPRGLNVANELAPAVMANMDSPRLRGLGVLALQRAGRVWHDTFYRRTYCDWDGTVDGRVVQARTIDDAFVRNVAAWLAQQDGKLGNITDRQAHSWIETAAHGNKRNAPRDWLNGLVWDGEQRLGQVLAHGFGAHQTPFNETISRCWFVGMVARIMRPGCQLDTMPVLIGPQGIGKSQALRLIGGAWYRSAISDIHSKDFKQELFGAIVFEIPELHSLITSNAAAAKVKAVISNQVDHFRLPYGYTVEEFQRTAVMVGTTNNRDWHHDESGARRFWPIHCDGVDLQWITENREQLFAEAYSYFQLGADDQRGRWWLNDADEAEQRELMAHETAEDSWEHIIITQLQRNDAARPQIFGRDSNVMTWHDGTLSETTDWGNLLTTARIAYQWLWLNSEQAGRRNTANRIGSIMRNLGWRRIQIRIPASTMRVWAWKKTESSDTQDGAVVEPIVTNDDDIPF